MRGFSILPRRVRAVTGQVRDLTTGLFTFDVFAEIARERLERETARDGRAVVALIQLGAADLHPVTLRSVANAIRDTLRPYDLVGYQGGRFVILLDRCERDEAKQVCGRILRAMTGLTLEQPIGPSVGIASAPSDGSDLGGLIDHARRQFRSARPLANVPQPVSA